MIQDHETWPRCTENKIIDEKQPIKHVQLSVRVCVRACARVCAFVCVCACACVSKCIENARRIASTSENRKPQWKENYRTERSPFHQSSHFHPDKRKRARLSTKSTHITVCLFRDLNRDRSRLLWMTVGPKGKYSAKRRTCKRHSEENRSNFEITTTENGCCWLAYIAYYRTPGIITIELLVTCHQTSGPRIPLAHTQQKGKEKKEWKLKETKIKIKNKKKERKKVKIKINKWIKQKYMKFKPTVQISANTTQACLKAPVWAHKAAKHARSHQHLQPRITSAAEQAQTHDKRHPPSQHKSQAMKLHGSKRQARHDVTARVQFNSHYLTVRHCSASDC